MDQKNQRAPAQKGWQEATDHTLWAVKHHLESLSVMGPLSQDDGQALEVIEAELEKRGALPPIVEEL